MKFRDSNSLAQLLLYDVQEKCMKQKIFLKLILVLIFANNCLSEDLIFEVNPSQSNLRMSANIGGFQTIAQSLNSDLSSYSGTIVLNQNGNNLKISSSNINAQIIGSFPPGLTGDPYNSSFPSNYALELNEMMPFYNPGIIAVRNLVFNLNQINPQSLINNKFSLSNLNATALQGYMDINLGEFYDYFFYERENLIGKYAFNSVSEAVLENNNSKQILKIPLSFNLPYGSDGILRFQGEIIAIRNIQIPTPHAPADFNGDCLIDNQDYTIYRNNFGARNATLSMGDGNGDGSVDAADYTVFRDNLGTIPEACSTSALAIAFSEESEVEDKVKPSSFNSAQRKPTRTERYLSYLKYLMDKYTKRRPYYRQNLHSKIR